MLLVKCPNLHLKQQNVSTFTLNNKMSQPLSLTTKCLNLYLKQQNVSTFTLNNKMSQPLPLTTTCLNMHLQPLGNNSWTMIYNEVTLSKANHKTFPNNQIWLAGRKQAPRIHIYRSERLTAGQEKCQSRPCGRRIYRLVKPRGLGHVCLL